MAKFKEKQKALEMRRLGMSYSQIKTKLGVSKSTLSYWLREFPLSENRIRELRDWSEVRIEKYIKTRRLKRENKLKQIYNQERKVILPISKRDLFIGGLFLYWGEGGKTAESRTYLANTDPKIIRTFIYWLEKCFNIPKIKMFVRLHLYNDMDIKEEVRWWSNILQIPESQFKKPYIKSSKLESINYKNGFGHGTCNIVVGDVNLAKRVKMGLKIIGENFNLRGV